VFISGGDPIATGLVSSLSRPGGNATGVNFITALGAKRLDLLHALLPNVTLVALLTNPNYPLAEADKKEVQGAAHALGRQLLCAGCFPDLLSQLAMSCMGSGIYPIVCPALRLRACR
jgi:ABC-type uncharacterized transport system substrate-binding protein